MSASNEHRPSPLGGLHYLLIFSAFGLLMLVLMGPKFQRRQGNIEGQFEGIRAVQHQEQQRTRPGETPDPRFQPSQPVGPNDEPGLIISLKPLMVAAAIVMLLAWAGLQWRRMQRASRSSLPDWTSNKSERGDRPQSVE